jgi:hypothetical protein
VLNRPSVRNALDARMRDDLVAALAVAAHDPSIAPGPPPRRRPGVLRRRRSRRVRGAPTPRPPTSSA